MNTTMNGIGVYGALNTSSVSQTKVDKLSSALANTKECNNQELMDVCKDFEAYFLEQVFKSMEKTVMKDEDSITNSGYMSYFQDMLTQKYAENATEQGGYGIAQMLYESMKR